MSAALLLVLGALQPAWSFTNAKLNGPFTAIDGDVASFQISPDGTHCANAMPRPTWCDQCRGLPDRKCQTSEPAAQRKTKTGEPYDSHPSMYHLKTVSNHRGN